MNKREHKQTLLNQLYEPYKKCLECPLAFAGRKNVVFGEGNPDAAVMLIGEAPGQNEDEQGRPFIGRSGKFLTKIFLELGINREDVFITSVVKCRPPKNRKPFPVEINTCTNLLLFNQINIIQPRAICTLGSSAIEGLLKIKNIKITDQRGTVLYLNAIPVIPTFHPAYVLRALQNTALFSQDLQKAFNIASGNK